MDGLFMLFRASGGVGILPVMSGFGALFGVL